VIEIDHYGERLIGCIDCNRWSWQGSKRLLMELPEEDLHALRERGTWKVRCTPTSGSSPAKSVGPSRAKFGHAYCHQSTVAGTGIKDLAAD
jgi:hypothetical protein